MAIAPTEYRRVTELSLESIDDALREVAARLSSSHRTLSARDAVQTLVGVEGISRIVDHLQIVAAGLAEDLDLASTEPQAGFKNSADYLRTRLGIGRAEAKRRLVLAREVLAGVTPTGAPVEPPMRVVGTALAVGALSGRAASIICSSVDRMRCVAAPDQLESMERHLTLQARESDEDVLRVLARRWETMLDQDGQEPTEKLLEVRQGVFLHGRRHGLNMLEIGATDDQFEQLMTVMSTATNPRTPGTSPGMSPGMSPGTSSESASVFPSEGPTRPQSLLNGLVGACRIALSTAHLPATGGHRPQVMVTIDYKDLLGDLDTSRRDPGVDDRSTRRRGVGRAIFADRRSVRSIRRIACDADLIPIVLGGEGQILDVGRAARLFPPHLRRALVARDRGCAFPDCTVPASWCEAHHLVPWSRGGATSIDNGVLLCAHHHHVIHLGDWDVASHDGILWFTPPPHSSRDGTAARRNRYWHAQPLPVAGIGAVSVAGIGAVSAAEAEPAVSA